MGLNQISQKFNYTEKKTGASNLKLFQKEFIQFCFLLYIVLYRGI